MEELLEEMKKVEETRAQILLKLADRMQEVLVDFEAAGIKIKVSGYGEIDRVWFDAFEREIYCE